jgi:hypothetical protein
VPVRIDIGAFETIPVNIKKVDVGPFGIPVHNSGL